jgi:hypothetical protein
MGFIQVFPLLGRSSIASFIFPDCLLTSIFDGGSTAVSPGKLWFSSLEMSEKRWRLRTLYIDDAEEQKTDRAPDARIKLPFGGVSRGKVCFSLKERELWKSWECWDLGGRATFAALTSQTVAWWTLGLTSHSLKMISPGCSKKQRGLLL